MKKAIVTGATSGIGRAFAEKLAGLGYDLILTGRREDVIRKVSDEISKRYGVEVQIVIVDFSNLDEVEKLIGIIEGLDEVGALVNNVGFGNERNFLEDEYETQEKMLTVHINTTCRICHSVIKKMQSGSFIINVSSMAAFTPAGFNHFYSATKAFINTFSEALYVSLSDKGINVQSLCPGFTRTDFHNKLGMDKSKLVNRGMVRWMKAEDVVEKSMAALDKGKVIYIPGFLNKLMYRILKIIPKKMYYRMAKKFSI